MVRRKGHWVRARTQRDASKVVMWVLMLVVIEWVVWRVVELVVVLAVEWVVALVVLLAVVSAVLLVV